MKLFIVQLVIVIGTFCDLISCSGYFTLVGPKLLRQNAKYSVAITSRNFEDSNIPTLEVAIQNGNGNWKRVQNITLINGKVQSLEFDLKGQPIDDYTLGVKSIKGQEFSGVAKLNMNTKNVSAFVQTDKAIYKPNDTVQFRVLVLNENLRPLDEKCQLQVHITDGADNRVKQFGDVIFIKGVFESQFKLSDLPVLGDWHIHVTVNNKQETSKAFGVAEYTLPNYEVTLDVNPHTNVDEQKIRATLVAKYTFGKIAKGKATVTAELGGLKVSKAIEVSGKKLVEFDMENELGTKYKRYEKTVKLFASFKEELTGRVQNTTAYVQVHTTPHKIEIKKNSKKFKPGLPFTIRAIVLYHDKNAPVTDSQNPVIFTQTFYYERMKMCRRSTDWWSVFFSSDDLSEDNWQSEDYECPEVSSYEEKSHVYPTNGISEIDIHIPDNIIKLDVSAKYLETVDNMRYIRKDKSRSNNYITIKSKTEKPHLTENIKINIQSTKNIDEFSYHVLTTNGDVAASDTVEILSSKNVDFEFTPTYDMIPNAKIVVFYITNDGEVISDSLQLELDNHLRNFIDIEIPKSQMSPSELINISIKSNPNSFVGLLGVDQSVLVLKKGNDIEESVVFDDLKHYNEVNRKNEQWIPSYYQKTYLDFESSEVVVITNAEKEYVPRINQNQRFYRPSSGVFQFPPRRLLSGDTHTSLIGITSTAGYGLRSEYSPLMRSSANNNLRGTVSVTEIRKTVTELTEIRKTFPETWLFDSLNFEFNQTNATISKKVPDTITSWIITGFSIDPITGLGLTKKPTKFNVFQPFFVTMNLPYSIKRGEIVSIPISVFNYMENNQTVEVTLHNEDSEFEYIEAREEARNSRRKRTVENLKTKNIVVTSQSGSSTSFMIRPINIGLIKIKVVANSLLAGDGAERYLIVEPEGVKQYMNKAVFIDLRNSEKFETNICIDIPSNVVPDSFRVEASATGDILGPSIENLDKLIKLPYGCGEQNMLNFVPNIVVLDYLIAVNKLTSEIKEKAIKFLESGYQRQLTYKHDDGSYSIWGKRDRSGSTWLTAFVAKSFRQASKYISIDPEIIKQALQFLSNAQTEDGSFVEKGYVFQKDLQGGSSNGISLTAYTLITFLENPDFVATYKITIDKALAFLNENHNNVTDNYSLAIMAYALHLADHSLKNVILSKLETGAITEGGMIYWRKNSSASDENRSYKSSSLDIEMTAYALQAFLEAGRLTESIQIMKWLVSQRNGNGGFTSTQDTVVGLQALSKMATQMYAPNSNIDITVKHNSNHSSTLLINERNALILQKHELPSTAKDFEITAEGHGFTIFQLSYQYNIDTSSKERHRFIINPVVNSTSNKNFLHLKVCTHFIPDEIAAKSNMAVMEVTFPSGFVFDTDFLPELESTNEVKKVEIKDRKTVVVVYFDDLGITNVCPEFIAFRTHSVAMQKPASVVVYDYYDTNRHALGFYNLPEVSVCDICDDDKVCLQECDEMINGV